MTSAETNELEQCKRYIAKLEQNLQWERQETERYRLYAEEQERQKIASKVTYKNFISKLRQELNWANQEVQRYLRYAQEADSQRSQTLDQAIYAILEDPVETLEKYVKGSNYYKFKTNTEDVIAELLQKRVALSSFIVKQKEDFLDLLEQDVTKIQKVQEDVKECAFGKLLEQVSNQMIQDAEKGWRFYYSIHRDDQQLHIFRVHCSGIWDPSCEFENSVTMPMKQQELIKSFCKRCNFNTFYHLDNSNACYFDIFKGMQLDCLGKPCDDDED